MHQRKIGLISDRKKKVSLTWGFLLQGLGLYGVEVLCGLIYDCEVASTSQNSRVAWLSVHCAAG